MATGQTKPQTLKGSEGEARNHTAWSLWDMTPDKVEFPSEKIHSADPDKYPLFNHGMAFKQKCDGSDQMQKSTSDDMASGSLMHTPAATNGCENAAGAHQPSQLCIEPQDSASPPQAPKTEDEDSEMTITDNENNSPPSRADSVYTATTVDEPAEPVEGSRPPDDGCESVAIFAPESSGWTGMSNTVTSDPGFGCFAPMHGSKAVPAKFTASPMYVGLPNGVMGSYFDPPYGANRSYAPPTQMSQTPQNMHHPVAPPGWGYVQTPQNMHHPVAPSGWGYVQQQPPYPNSDSYVLKSQSEITVPNSGTNQPPAPPQKAEEVMMNPDDSLLEPFPINQSNGTGLCSTAFLDMLAAQSYQAPSTAEGDEWSKLLGIDENGQFRNEDGLMDLLQWPCHGPDGVESDHVINSENGDTGGSDDAWHSGEGGPGAGR